MQASLWWSSSLNTNSYSASTTSCSDWWSTGTVSHMLYHYYDSLFIDAVHLGWLFGCVGSHRIWQSCWPYSTVLHDYIEAAQVTVYSTSMSGYDDLPGLGGIQMHDSYHLCQYFSKGLAQYVVIRSIHNYIIPIALDDNADRYYVWISDPHGSGTLALWATCWTISRGIASTCSYVIPTSYHREIPCGVETY